MNYKLNPSYLQARLGSLQRALNNAYASGNEQRRVAIHIQLDIATRWLQGDFLSWSLKAAAIRDWTWWLKDAREYDKHALGTSANLDAVGRHAERIRTIL